MTSIQQRSSHARVGVRSNNRQNLKAVLQAGLWLLLSLGINGVWAADDAGAPLVDDASAPLESVNEGRAEYSDASCEVFDFVSVLRNRFRDSSRLDTSAIDDLAGRTINRIRYLRVGVFDETNPDEDKSLYRFLNRLHINTKEYVISGQLLFAEGDSLDPRRIHETERLLRRRDYLTGAIILPEVICADRVDLVVTTRDSWSLEVDASFSHSGGDSSSGFGVSDDNILGTGNALSIGYEQDSDRSGIRYTFSTDHLLNTRVATRLSYADTSDGKNIVAEVEQPFYSRLTRWAGGGHYWDISEVEIIRSSDEIINEFRHETLWQEAYVGHAIHIDNDSTQRVLVGYTEERDRFAPNENTLLGVPDEREAKYPWVEYQYLEDKYAVYRNLNQIQRTEDVPLGITLDMRVGYGEAGPARHGNVIRYIGSYQQIFSVDDHHLLSLNFGVNGRDHTESDDNDSAVWSSKIAYNYMHSYKNRWYTSLSYDAGQDLEQYEELTVGGINGMRGYPTDFQRGSKRVLATIERRYYSDWHWFNLVRVGAVAFVEAGKAWDGPNGINNPMLANVGIGLRLSSSKVRVGNVVHLDIATPLIENDSIDDYQILVKAQQHF